MIAWKRRFAHEGVAGLDDRPKSGRPVVIDPIEIVLATLEPPPQSLGVTHWSSRLLAKHLGISDYTVSTTWKKWGLQPWRVQTFKFSTDPELEAKIRDVVGLYLNPPDKAIVLCIDELGRAGTRHCSEEQAFPRPAHRTVYVEFHITGSSRSPGAAMRRGYPTIFFGIITRQAIRRGTFTSVKDLIAAIRHSSTAGTNAANRSSGRRPPTTSSRKPSDPDQRVRVS